MIAGMIPTIPVYQQAIGVRHAEYPRKTQNALEVDAD
jgi:hypothetical protein